MLPDIPPIKQEISRKLREFFKMRVNYYMGALNESARYYIKEGNHVITIRPDGKTDETELKQASTETSIKFEEVPRLDARERFEKLDKSALEMANQISKNALETLHQAVEQVGNVVKSEGRPPDPDLILAVYERIQIEFDEKGNPEELMTVAPPIMEQQLKEAIRMLHEDPIYKKKYKELIDKKRVEWRDREAARRLVG